MIAVGIVVLVFDGWVRRALLAFAVRTSAAALAAVAVLLALALVLDATIPRTRRATTGSTWIGLQRRVVAVPSFVWLTAIVTLGAAIRVVLAPVNSVPTVLGDELIYSGLAKGFATHTSPLLRGELELGYGLVYPLFASIAWIISSEATSAFGVLKVMNAVAMAAAGVPAYFLARRVVSTRWALGVAAMTAAAPWTVYSAFVLTESVFYPAFVLFALLVTRMLENPSHGRQLVVVSGLVMLVLVRPQGAVLALSLLAAVALASVHLGSLRGGVRTYVVIVGGLALLALGYVALGVTGVPRPGEAYLVLFDQGFHPVALATWTARTLAAYELGLGVVAFVAFPLALAGLLRRDAQDRERSVGIAAATLAGGILLSVIVLSAGPYGLDRLHERNLFYITPLVLTCFAHWLANGLRRPRGLTAAAVIGGAALPLALGAHLLQRTPAVDALITSVFRNHVDTPITHDARDWAISLCAAGLLVFVVARRPLVPVLTVVVAFGLLTAKNVYPGQYIPPLSHEQTRALGWIDRALPEGETADLLHISCDRDRPTCSASDAKARLLTWSEFFNMRVHRVFRLGPEVSGALPTPELSVAPDGTLLDDDGPLSSRYIALDSSRSVVGRPIARIVSPEYSDNAVSLVLWYADQPVRLDD